MIDEPLFKPGEKVVIKHSGQECLIIGRAKGSTWLYKVEYYNNVQQWYRESNLKKLENILTKLTNFFD